MISVIIPVLDGADNLRRCLEAVRGSQGVVFECLVVDDGSRDGSTVLARRLGATVLTTPAPRQGPAVARNVGARAAHGDLLLFIDADVVVRPDTLARFAAHFAADPDLAACFGSYDDSPAAPNFLSQYRNLHHHYVHQRGQRDANTFWAGCGAVRRDIFLEMGGFTTAYGRPCIEDIELGYRLRAAGHAILLDPTIQVTHHKRWTAGSVLVTDIRDRALPWARLLARRGALGDELNLRPDQRASGLLAITLAAGMLAGSWKRGGRLLAAASAASLLFLNRGFYRFLVRRRGALFALAALPWHWLYFFYSSAAFAVATVQERAGHLPQVIGLRLPERAK